MPKSKTAYEKLFNFFPISLSLARQVTKSEHRVNPLLNILNMTAKSISQYPDLVEKSGVLWRSSNSLIGASAVIIKSLIYWPKAIKFESDKNKADLLLVSHLTTIKHLSNLSDFYFGDLALKLEAVGYSTQTVLINHCQATAVDKQNNKLKNTTILPAFLSPWQETKNIVFLIFASLTIPNADRSALFRRRIQWAQFSSRAIGDYRIGRTLTNHIKNQNPRAVLFTFEGHGWERLMLAECRNAGMSTIFAGYQHAVLFPGAKSLNHQYGQGADPDHIFTAGRITFEQLKRESEFNYISILGSVKAQHDQKPIRFNSKGHCLIAPEGTISEVIFMTKLAIDAAYLYSDQKFVLRLHPVLDRVKTIKRLKRLFSFPHNFSISTANLETDLTRSSWLCYRGSSMAFQGIVSGLRPIYLDFDQMAENNDPIPKKLTFHRIATNGTELADLIRFDKANVTIGQQEFQSAMSFAKKYFVPLNAHALIKYLEKNLI
jgi:hypothetical protein